MIRSGLAILVLCLASAGSTAAQEIVDEPRWGFDDTIVPNRFNLLTVRVRNPTDQPINKHLQLVKSAGGLRRGAPMVQSCYLGPGAERFVQFHPFVVSTGDFWRLSWVEGGAAGKTIGQPTASIPCTILLEQEPLRRTKRLRLKSFPPRLLPSSATAMGTLRAIVLDQDPDLSLPQRTALLEWLRRGGEVHLLLRGMSHRVFKDELAVLNSDQPVIAYGSGRVFRHEFDRFALRKEVPVEIYGGAPPVHTMHPGGTPVSILKRQKLREDIRLEFGWGLIFTMAVIYLALIGPLLYRLSTNRLSWPFSLAALAGIVAIATWMFTVIGARGNDEKAMTKSWSYARMDGKEHYEVIRFADVFVTTGGDYEFGAGNGYSLFSSAQVTERVNGQILNGSKGRYTVDMPRFSARFVVQKNTVVGPEAAIEFDGKVFKTDLDLTRIVSVNGTRLYRWLPDGPGRYRRSGSSRIDRVLRDRDLNRLTLEDTVIERMHLKNMDLRRSVTLDRHHVFFCIGPTPEEFHLQGKGPGVDLGRENSVATVYRFDVLLKEK